MPIRDVILGAAALLLVLALIWLAGRAAVMTGFARPPKAGDGRLRVVQSISIDPRRKVVLIECDGRGHLLLTGGGGDVSLGWVASEGAPLAAGGAPMQEKS